MPELMRTYTEIPGLGDILLEESWVLDIEAHPGRIAFTMEFVLTQTHPDYHPPREGEQFCYRNGTLVISGVTRSLWSDQGPPPAVDAADELDFGKVDSFQWDGSQYVAEGCWGRLELYATEVQVHLS